MRTTPTPERTRRRDGLAKLMDEHGYEAMLVCGRGDEFTRGRIQYVADVFQWAGWGFVVLPRAGEPVFVGDPLGGYDDGGAEAWVSEALLTQAPGRATASILGELGASRGVIGVVGLADVLAAAHLDELEAALPHAVLADATDPFDDFRAVKSETELKALAETSAILRTVFAALEAEIRPGALERDVLAEAQRLCRQHGCVDGIALLGRPPRPGFGWGSDEPIARGDVVVVDLEWGGPSGYWLELRRCFSVGEPRGAVRRYWEARVEAFEACVGAMRPGASSDEILAARDRVYEKHGLTAGNEVRYSAHGIGIDSLEPPWAPGKERVLREGMVLSLHPNVELPPEDVPRYGAVSVGDSVVVTSTGARRMTYETEEWVVLDD